MHFKDNNFLTPLRVTFYFKSLYFILIFFHLQVFFYFFYYANISCQKSLANFSHFKNEVIVYKPFRLCKAFFNF
jgi:hypothetical protein